MPDLDFNLPIGLGQGGEAMRMAAEAKRQESLDRLAFRKIYGAIGAQPLRSLPVDDLDADGGRIYGQNFMNQEMDVKWLVRRFESGRTFAGALPALWTLWRKPRNRLPEYEALMDFVSGRPDVPAVLVTKYADRSEMIAYAMLRGRGDLSGIRRICLVDDEGNETAVMELDSLLDVAAAMLGRERNDIKPQQAY